MSKTCVTFVEKFEKVLGEGPSCVMPAMANTGSALLNAAFVGIPGIPSAAEAVPGSNAPDTAQCAARVAKPRFVHSPRIEVVRLVRDILLPQRARKPDHIACRKNRSRDHAASIRQWRYRLLDIVKVRVACKAMVLFADLRVQADIKLVLMVDIIAHSHIVVRRRTSWSAADSVPIARALPDRHDSRGIVLFGNCVRVKLDPSAPSSQDHRSSSYQS